MGQTAGFAAGHGLSDSLLRVMQLVQLYFSVQGIACDAKSLGARGDIPAILLEGFLYAFDFGFFENSTLRWPQALIAHNAQQHLFKSTQREKQLIQLAGTHALQMLFLGIVVPEAFRTFGGSRA